MRFYLTLYRDAAISWVQDQAPRLGAALAYYTVFSLAPLVIITIGIASIVFGSSNAEQYILGEFSRLLGENTKELLIQMVRRPPSVGTGIAATIIGAIMLLIGAGGIFGQLRNALHEVYHVHPKKKTIREKIGSFAFSYALVLTTGFLLLVSLLIQATLTALQAYATNLVPLTPLLWLVISFTVSTLIATVLFAGILRYVPDVRMPGKAVWLGAATAAILFMIGKFAIGAYLGRGNFTTTYGAAASLAIILFWTYYSAQILLFGAEVVRIAKQRLRL